MGIEINNVQNGKNKASAQLTATSDPSKSQPYNMSSSTMGGSLNRRDKDVLERIFSSIHFRVAYMDLDFNFIHVNKAYAEAGGHPAEFYPGKNYFDLYPDEEDERRFREVIRSGKSCCVEAKPFKYAKVSGRDTTYWDWNIQPVRNDQNKVTGLVLTLIDVTQRTVQAKELARLAEDLADQAQLLELVHDAIFVHDLSGKIIYWNSGAEHIYGFSRDDVIDKVSHDILKTQFPESLAKIISKLLSTGSWEGELIHNTRNGRRIIVETRWALRKDERDKPVAILQIDRDITERRQAEVSASEVRQYAESIIETIQVALLVLSPNLKVQSANKTFYETFCTSPQETEGKFIYDIGSRQWDIPELRILLEDILPKNTSFEDFEIEHEFENIGFRTMLLNARRLYQQGSKTQLILLSIQDVTQVKLQQHRISADQHRITSLMEELLGAEERERRRIAVGLHDSVGQILVFLKREISLIRRIAPASLSQKLTELKKQVVNAIQHTRDLTFDLSPQTLYSFGLEAAIEELAEKFSHEHRLACYFEADDQSKPIAEQINVLLYRCVRELLNNIAKHAGAESVHISMKRMNTDIKITVVDDGRGFDPAILESVSKRKRFGLLSIRERLNYLGGRFSLQSSSGKGVTVVLTSPLDLVNVSDEETIK